MGPEVNKMIWTPGGSLSLEREQINCPPDYMRQVALLADTSAQMEIGLQCFRCKQILRGANAWSDAKWVMECGCRTYVGKNPSKAQRES